MEEKNTLSITELTAILLSIFQVILIILKLTSVLQLNWLIILIPMFIMLLCGLIIIIASAIFLCGLVKLQKDDDNNDYFDVFLGDEDENKKDN